MQLDELSGSVPGYRIAGMTQEMGATIVSLVNEASGERYAFDALRIEQLAGAAGGLGKRIHEDLTLLAAGMPVEGARKVGGARARTEASGIVRLFSPPPSGPAHAPGATHA